MLVIAAGYYDPHPLVNAVEVVANQFECPKVFIDAELVSDWLYK